MSCTGWISIQALSRSDHGPTRTIDGRPSASVEACHVKRCHAVTDTGFGVQWDRWPHDSHKTPDLSCGVAATDATSLVHVVSGTMKILDARSDSSPTVSRSQRHFRRCAGY